MKCAKYSLKPPNPIVLFHNRFDNKIVLNPPPNDIASTDRMHYHQYTTKVKIETNQ